MTSEYIKTTLSNKGYKLHYYTDKTIITSKEGVNTYAKSLSKLFKLVKESNYGTK